MFGMLVGAGVDVNAKSKYDGTALSYAALNGHAGVCEVLVGLGADVGVVDRDGRTAADDARDEGHAALSERLGTMVAWGRRGDGVDDVRLDEIAREVVGDGVSGRGVALVGVGIEGGSAALVRRGVGAGGVDLNGEMCGGMRSIEYAIMCGDSGEVVTALIELGADARWDGGQHLRDAARLGRARVCGALIGGGVDVHWVDGVGDTALHFAAMNGHLEVCEVLVACGARVGAVNKYNDTAAALARARGHEDVAKYLEGLK
jgi:ankyrin repeat protein